jgi:hypothetical protein
MSSEEKSLEGISMYDDKFILLGGIPRSGTTLTCHLFNQQPNSHALVESMNVSALVKLKTEKERVDYIGNYMSDIYSRIESSCPININVIENQNTNTFSENGDNGGGKRQNKITKKQDILISRELKENFKLILKHPNAFIALLPELKDSFKVVAQIRNPLSILASWNSLDHALSRGHAPMAEALNLSLKERLAEINDDLDRQIALLNWYYEIIDEHLTAEEVIKYEDLIESNGETLARIVPQHYSQHENLKNRNRNSLYNEQFLLKAFKRLITRPEHACWRFYNKRDIALKVTPRVE